MAKLLRSAIPLSSVRWMLSSSRQQNLCHLCRRKARKLSCERSILDRVHHIISRCSKGRATGPKRAGYSWRLRWWHPRTSSVFGRNVWRMARLRWWHGNRVIPTWVPFWWWSEDTRLPWSDLHHHNMVDQASTLEVISCNIFREWAFHGLTLLVF